MLTRYHDTNQIIREIPQQILFLLFDFLNEEEQEEMILNHGEFLKEEFFGVETKNYKNAVIKIKKIYHELTISFMSIQDSKIKNQMMVNKIIHMLDEKMKDIEIPMKYIKEMLSLLTETQKKAFYYYHFQELDVMNPYSNEESLNEWAIYQAYRRGYHKIKSFFYNILSRIELSGNEKKDETLILNEIRNNLILAIYVIPNDLMVFLMDFLPEKSQSFYYQVHGKDLKDVCTLKEKIPDYSLAEYNLYKGANELLMNVYINHKDEFALLSHEEIKLKIKKLRNYRISRKRKTILDEIPKNILKELIPILTATQKESFYLYHSENLDGIWPDNLKNQKKSKAALYQSYEEGTKKIRTYYAAILKKLNIITPSLEDEERIIMEIRKSFHCIIYEIPRDVLFFLVSLLPKKAKESFILRHGPQLNQILPFPKPPKDKSCSYYHTNYKNAEKKLRALYKVYLLENKFHLENEKKVLEEGLVTL